MKAGKDMKIGIIGAGNIGSTLAKSFGKLQHTVQIANSRGPETLSQVAAETGATPVAIAEVAKGVDLLVVTIPMKSVPLLPKDLLRELPPGTPILDTGNYYSMRDGVIDELEGRGLTESEWTSRVLGRPVTKVFNNITTYSLAHGGLPPGSQNRIALPVAGDDAKAKQMVIALLNDLGFDGLDAGPLSESWRQQPGTPVYGTDHTADVVRSSLANADRSLAPEMRDVMLQKLLSLPRDTPPQEFPFLARALWSAAGAQ